MPTKTNLHRILLLTENEKVRNFIMPLSQWLELHAPIKPLDALERISQHAPELIVVDSMVLSPMIMNLLTMIRTMPQYQGIPVVMLGDSAVAKKVPSEAMFPPTFNLRRLEEKIAELLNTRLVGRASHGPHSGSIY
jgi:hypothetical protein